MQIRKFSLCDSRYALVLLSFSFITPRSLALFVVDGSDCTAACSATHVRPNSNFGNTSCFDTDYTSTDSGVLFQSCVSCELKSLAFKHGTGQTDLGWALCKSTGGLNQAFIETLTLRMSVVNMRYTLDECLFSQPNATVSKPNNQCNVPCSPLSNSIQTNLLTPNASSSYDYCADPTFIEMAQNCASCYKIIPNQVYISNCRLQAGLYLFSC